MRWTGHSRQSDFRHWRLARACGMAARALLLALPMLWGCAAPSVPVSSPPAQFALAAAENSPFATLARDLQTRQGEDHSGFLLLDDNRAALEWRLRLIDSARNSIDLQYYLWYGDNTGRLIAHRLLAAARRGVRVRLLVDDLNTLLRDASSLSQRDDVAAWLGSHPNVELRLFNPWKNRHLAGRLGESLAEVSRVNQRMHNKALIVDNLAVILGGRNLGDEYMGLNTHFNFRDLDVLGIGPVAGKTSLVFDAYWNSDWVADSGALGVTIGSDERNTADSRLAEALRLSSVLEDLSVEPRDWTADIAALATDLIPGGSRVVSDLPGMVDIEHVMLEEIQTLVRSAKQQLRVVNAYIIPREETITTLAGLHARGVTIDILTNSLASHDVPAVNSHYKRWRAPLVKAGARLFEMRHDGVTQRELADTPPVQSEFMGLHSKAMLVDDRVYIGSMNYDPRSAALNCEMGVIIDSPDLAAAVSAIIDRDIQPDNSWQVTLDDSGRLTWSSSAGEVQRQPARNWWQRVEDVFFKAFPEELY